MARTFRKLSPGSARWANRLLEDENPLNVRRGQRLKKGAASHSSDKCGTAQVDSEGGFKLDTWTETARKRNAQEVTRRRRRAGKILAARQLEDMNDNEHEPESVYDMLTD